MSATATAEFERLIENRDILGATEYVGRECWKPDCPYCPRIRALRSQGVSSASSDSPCEVPNTESRSE